MAPLTHSSIPQFIDHLGRWFIGSLHRWIVDSMGPLVDSPTHRFVDTLMYPHIDAFFHPVVHALIRSIIRSKSLAWARWFIRSPEELCHHSCTGWLIHTLNHNTFNHSLIDSFLRSLMGPMTNSRIRWFKLLLIHSFIHPPLIHSKSRPPILWLIRESEESFLRPCSLWLIRTLKNSTFARSLIHWLIRRLAHCAIRSFIDLNSYCFAHSFVLTFIQGVCHGIID